MSATSQPTQPPTLSVSQLNRQAKRLLESHFDYVWVEGEVSNFASPSSGHWYFSLKDGDAQVRCAMFRNYNQRLRFRPQNGDSLRLRARVSLYEGRGEFQLIVEFIEPAGAGALQAAFEKLKAKLTAEGLFDEARKRPLPESIAHLAVITSPTGAALHDILTVLARRCPAIAVTVLPVAVQGEHAADQIAAAIARANLAKGKAGLNFDALIVGRGGGSLEDLWAFNEEIVARAIAASALPVVSAVGHEVDFSIADLVADYRAPTPSAAAELLSPDQILWYEQLLGLRAALAQRMASKLHTYGREALHLSKRLKHPGALLREQSQRLDELEQRLLRAQALAWERHYSYLALLRGRLSASSPQWRIESMRARLARQRQQLGNVMQRRLLQGKQDSARLAQVLDSLSPLAILGRGYALLTDAGDQVISRATQVAPGDAVQAKLAEGVLTLEVKERS